MVQVSVIVPVFNLKRYVLDCVKGLLDQKTQFDFEIVVVDDGSNDGSYDLVAELSAKHVNSKLFRNSENLELPETMRHLLRQAKGDFIAYVDGDDLAYPGKLEALAGYLSANTNCSIAYHDAAMFDSDSGKFLQYYTRDNYNIAYIPAVAAAEDLIKYGCFINASSVMFRRHDHLAEAVADGCKILLDYPFHILNALYGGGSIDRIDEIYAGYRIHADSFGGRTRANPERRLQSLRDQEHACDLARPFGVSAEIIHQGKVHHRFSAALFFLKSGNDSLFQQCIENASRDGWFFDDRQRFAFQHCKEPDFVRSQLFPESVDG